MASIPPGSGCRSPGRHSRCWPPRPRAAPRRDTPSSRGRARQLKHVLLLLRFGARTPMPSSGMPEFSARSPATSPACVPALPVACTTWSIAKAHVVGLLHQFQRAVDIAQRAHRIGAAAGDDDRARALRAGAARATASISACMSAPPGRVSTRRPMQMVEQHVAVLGDNRGSGEPVRSSSRRWQAMPELGRRRRGLARMVGLRRALRHHDVGTLRLRLAHQELQLAGLVAAASTGPVQSSRLIQISGPAQMPGQPSADVSSGVGRWASRKRGKRARCMEQPCPIRGTGTLSAERALAQRGGEVQG